MIKQFSKGDSFTHYSDAEWPISPKKTDTIFEPRKSYRKINVLIDAHLLEEDGEMYRLTKQHLLSSLLASELINFYRYADAGPPNGTPVIKIEEHFWLNSRPAYMGWAVAYPYESDGGYWPVTYVSDETSISNSSVSGNIVQFAESDETSHAYELIDVMERATKRKSDMLALEIANQAIQADLYITDRDYLLISNRLIDGRGASIATLEEAIPMLSLYLRSQAVFIQPTTSEVVKLHYSKGLFYWVGTRERLSESWRWFSACVYHSNGIGNDKLHSLGGAVLSRTQSALEARDRVHIALNRKTNNDVNDDALGNLDHVLMLLMGAVDASARVAHYVLGIQSKDYYAGWQQQDKWLKEVRKKRPELAELFKKNTQHYYALEILRLLRNSIHGEAIKGVTLVSGGKTDIVLKIPKQDELDILRFMDALGGREAWGYQPFAKGHDNVIPSLLVDKLMDETLLMLNAIMKETPVELLSFIEKAKKTNQPPYEKNKGEVFNTFSEWNRTSIRWQLGL